MGASRREKCQSDYDIIMAAITEGDLSALEEYSALIDDFPAGKDHFVWRHWIINAVDCGALQVVEWMLKKGVPLFLKVEGGGTPFFTP